MTTPWMLYAIGAAIVATLAGLLLERPLRDRRLALRTLWIALVAVSLVWPVVVAVSGWSGIAILPSVVLHTAPPIVPAPTNPVLSRSREALRSTPAPAGPTPGTATAAPRAPSGFLGDTLTVLLVGALLIEWIRIARARRRWRATTVGGVPVLLSANFGPAIVGVIHPVIVIPEWALELPLAQQQMMLAHEQEHLRAGDARLLALGFVALICAPWNLGLWWQMRRLRLAIEIDCDRRVLRREADVAGYGALLLAMGERVAGGSLLVAGFAERRSMLRTRIDAMTARAPAALTRANIGRLAFGVALLLAACLITPAVATATHETIVRIALQPNTGDSITAPDNPKRLVAAAADLPAAFQVLQMSDSTTLCASMLIDTRDSTRLTVVEAYTVTNGGPDPRGATRQERVSTGLYRVVTAGRYGVGADQLLRIDCGTERDLVVSREEAATAQTPPLNVVGAIERRFGVMADSLVLLPHHLTVTMPPDSVMMPAAHAEEIGAFALTQLGSMAAPIDTVSVTGRAGSLAAGRTSRSTWSFYPGAYWPRKTN